MIHLAVKNGLERHKKDLKAERYAFYAEVYAHPLGIRQP